MDESLVDLIAESLIAVAKGVAVEEKKVVADKSYLNAPEWTPPASVVNVKLTEDPLSKEEYQGLLDRVDVAIEQETALKEGLSIAAEVLNKLKTVLPLFI